MHGPGRRRPKFGGASVILALVALACCQSCGGSATGSDWTVAGNGEPAYCDPGLFPQYEIPISPEESRHLVRLRAFRLGRTVLAGLAIGSSETAAVIGLAERFSTATGGDRYCTWYLGTTSAEASLAFTHRPLPTALDLEAREAVPIYLDVLGSSFADDPVSFLSCAREHAYVAVGCDGQKHRGPTVFGMLLAYSGCLPEHAARITNDLWGLNGVSPDVRLAIIRGAYDLGQAHAGRSALLAARLEP